MSRYWKQEKDEWVISEAVRVSHLGGVDIIITRHDQELLLRPMIEAAGGVMKNIQFVLPNGKFNGFRAEHVIYDEIID